MAFEDNLVAKWNPKPVPQLVLIRIIFGFVAAQTRTGWRRGRANHVIIIVVVILRRRWRGSDEGSIVLERMRRRRRRKGRVCGGTEGMEPFLGRGRDGRKMVGVIGIGIGIGSWNRTTSSVVDGFERGLRLWLLPKGKRELSSNTIVYLTLFFHFYAQYNTTTIAFSTSTISILNNLWVSVNSKLFLHSYRTTFLGSANTTPIF